MRSLGKDKFDNDPTPEKNTGLDEFANTEEMQQAGDETDKEGEG